MSTIPFVHMPRSPSPPKNDRPARPSAFQQLAELAEAGEFGAVLDHFVRPPSSSLDTVTVPELGRLLRLAVDRASQKSPRRFTAAMFRHLTSFIFYATLRTQICVEQDLRATDARNQDGARHSEELETKLLPALERLTRLSVEISLGWASTERRWDLVQRGARARRRKAVGHSYQCDAPPDVDHEGEQNESP